MLCGAAVAGGGGVGRAAAAAVLSSLFVVLCLMRPVHGSAPPDVPVELVGSRRLGLSAAEDNAFYVDGPAMEDLKFGASITAINAYFCIGGAGDQYPVTFGESRAINIDVECSADFFF